MIFVSTLLLSSINTSHRSIFNRCSFCMGKKPELRRRDLTYFARRYVCTYVVMYIHTLSAFCAICWIADDYVFFPSCRPTTAYVTIISIAIELLLLPSQFLRILLASRISAEYTNRTPIHYDSPLPLQPLYIKYGIHNAGYSVGDRGDNLVDKEVPIDL